MMIRLPGRCPVCSADLVWTGKRWRTAPVTKGGGAHVCPEDRPLCNALMRYGERCARRPGHTTEHRTRYAMDNALEQATGRRKAA
jgi:hypothetical protein